MGFHIEYLWLKLNLILQQLEEFNDVDACLQVRDILMMYIAGFKPQCDVED